MKILITGASGFIGSYLFKNFKEEGHIVYGIVRKKPNLGFLKKNKKEIILADLNDFKSLEKNFPKSVDLIIHAGASNDQDTNKNIRKAYETNIYGTRNICELAKRNNVKKFVYMSVLQVYGRELKNKISEKSEINCDNDYALSHYLSEEVCKNYSKNSKTKFSILRLGYMFGCPIEKKIDRKSLIPYAICDQVVRQNQINLKTKGRANRDFVSLKVLFNNLKKIIKINNLFTIYNFTSGYSFSIKEIAQIVKLEGQKILKKNISVRFGNLKDKRNIFKVSSKLKLYENKLEILNELNYEIRKIINLIYEK